MFGVIGQAIGIDRDKKVVKMRGYPDIPSSSLNLLLIYYSQA